MPEAPVNENADTLGRKDEVRRARQFVPRCRNAKPVSSQVLKELALGCRAARAHAPHNRGTLLDAEHVRQSSLGQPEATTSVRAEYATRRAPRRIFLVAARASTKAAPIAAASRGGTAFPICRAMEIFEPTNT